MKAKHAFRSNLRYVIEQLGISQAEVARRAGVYPHQVCNVINGINEPLLTMAEKLAKAVGVHVGLLFLNPAEFREAYAKEKLAGVA